MPFDWNRIIRFCGWWLELFGTKLCMLAISYCRFWDCISIFFVHLSTDSVIWGQGRNLHFFRLRYFSLFIPTLLYEFTQFAYFFDGSLLKLLVLSLALNVSVTTDRHWIFWTNFLTSEQKFSGRLLVFFDSLFLWISSHRDTSHNFSDSTELTQMNQRHHTHIMCLNWLPSHTSKFALYEFV
jgi:hypothetical protein